MGVTFVKKLPNGDDEPVILSVRYEPTRMGVTFIKELFRWG